MRSELTVSVVWAALGLGAWAGGVGRSQAAPAPSTIPQPTHGQLVAAGLDKLPLAQGPQGRDGGGIETVTPIASRAGRAGRRRCPRPRSAPPRRRRRT